MGITVQIVNPLINTFPKHFFKSGGDLARDLPFCVDLRTQTSRVLNSA